jgi:hypothetical protein
MKTLKFSQDLVELVKNGSKTSTWRLFDDKDIKVDDLVTLIKRPELIPFAEAKVTEVLVKSFKELIDEDKEGHEKFDSEELMYKTYSDYYKQEVNPDTEVKIIRFTILKFIQE